MSIYVGDSSNIARKVRKIYVGDSSNIARRVKKVYVGDSSNVARLCFVWVGASGSPSIRSAATYSLTVQWKIPTDGGYYTGVNIRYATSGYPGSVTAGSAGPVGAGTTSSGYAYATISSLSANTTYYFSIFPYYLLSSKYWYGDVVQVAGKTGCSYCVCDCNNDCSCDCNSYTCGDCMDCYCSCDGDYSCYGPSGCC